MSGREKYVYYIHIYIYIYNHTLYYTYYMVVILSGSMRMELGLGLGFRAFILTFYVDFDGLLFVLIALAVAEVFVNLYASISSVSNCRT